MKIGFLLNDTRPAPGNGDEIIRAAQILASRHDVHVVSAIRPETRDYKFTLHQMRYHKEGIRAVQNLKPDVLCTYGLYSQKDAFHFVSTVRKAWYEHRERGWSKLLDVPGLAELYQESRSLGVRQYKAIIAASDSVKQDLIRYYNVAAQDVVVIAGGYASDQCNSYRCAALRYERRASLGYQPSDRVIVFVGNDFRQHGFIQLVRAMARLGRDDVKLLVVSNQSPKRFASEVRQLNMMNKIKFVGKIKDIAQYHAAGDLFVLPSFYEPSGLPMLEALACGLPVAVSADCAFAGLVEAGSNGVVFENVCNAEEVSSKLSHLLERGLKTSPHQRSAAVREFSMTNFTAKLERTLLGRNQSIVCAH